MSESPPGNEDVAYTVLALERAAMERWANGDPSGFLEISDPEVVYFDPFHQRRLDGLEALAKLYESLRGQVRLDRYEFVNPLVQVAGDIAVLTFNFESWSAGARTWWNTTEVYRRTEPGWRLIHTHWSLPEEGPSPAGDDN